ncbi:MAG: hypothetical protein R2762_06250 [Bryobacteraceae bacterium]
MRGFRILSAFLLLTPAFAATHYVTVAGIGGEPDYEQRFTNWAKDLDKALKGSGGDVQVHTLFGPEATKAKLSETLGKVAGEASPDDGFVLMLIGHGTFDGQDYKFNLKGPDATAIDLAAWCDRVPAKRQLVVNMTSASGASLAALQRANRGVITATKSGMEKNATAFARYWVEAMRDPGADADKNETVTALEAYQYADKKTVSFFETQKRLATEHAMLEDTGKGDAVRAPSAENGQGQLAGRFALLRIGSTQKAAADPAKQKLLARREQIEGEIDKLKYEKAAMPQQEYRKKLAALLLELARLQEELDK